MVVRETRTEHRFLKGGFFTPIVVCELGSLYLSPMTINLPRNSINLCVVFCRIVSLLLTGHQSLTVSYEDGKSKFLVSFLWMLVRPLDKPVIV